MTASQSDKFGLKRLCLENWLRVDPVWDAFGMSESSEAWVHDLLKANLDPVVPLPIRTLFETARGTVVYSLMFYPLLMIGTEQIFRVLEAAVTNKCIAMNAPSKVKRLFGLTPVSWRDESLGSGSLALHHVILRFRGILCAAAASVRGSGRKNGSAGGRT